MFEFGAACCCQGDLCCPCNPLYGGRTSWRASWSGLFRLAPVTECQEQLQAVIHGYGLQGVPEWNKPAELVLTNTLSITKVSGTVTWGSTNPTSPQFCLLGPPPVTFTPNARGRDFGFQWSDSLGIRLCRRVSIEYNQGQRLSARIFLSPPTRPCPTNPNAPTRPWLARVVCGDVATFEFTGTNDCGNPGPFTLSSTYIQQDGLSVGQFGVSNADWSPGVFSLS